MSGPTLVILAAGRARRYGGVKQLAPVGVNGEAVIDLIASDAFAGGFTRVVIVINPDTGPLIREHVERHWPPDRSVAFALQERPLGTVHAVLSAHGVVDATTPFAVANADDLYGRDAMIALGGFLRAGGGNCLVGFRLDRALVGDQPVTRGVCVVREGHLESIAERRKVSLTERGFESDDGDEPRSLDPSCRVSMNLWGFAPAMWSLFENAMAIAHDASEDAEVLLPVIVGNAVRDGSASFAVIDADSQCIGVTHAEDLPLVQAAVRAQVERGDRPAKAFDEPPQ
jgi:hypothetical protein